MVSVYEKTRMCVCVVCVVLRPFFSVDRFVCIFARTQQHRRALRVCAHHLCFVFLHCFTIILCFHSICFVLPAFEHTNALLCAIGVLGIRTTSRSTGRPRNISLFSPFLLFYLNFYISTLTLFGMKRVVSGCCWAFTHTNAIYICSDRARTVSSGSYQHNTRIRMQSSIGLFLHFLSVCFIYHTKFHLSRVQKCRAFP